MVGLAVLSKPMVLVLLTDKWVSMSELLSILCIAYMWYPVMVINNQMLNVRGRSDYFLKAEIIKKIVAIVILLLTMPLGLKILCLGILSYNILDMGIIIVFTKKVMNTGFRQQFQAILPNFPCINWSGRSNSSFFVDNFKCIYSVVWWTFDWCSMSSLFQFRFSY